MRTGFACLRVSGRGDVAEAEQQKVRLCPHLQGAVDKDQGESGTRCCHRRGSDRKGGDQILEGHKMSLGPQTER